MVSAVAATFTGLFAVLFPRLTFLDCAFISAPLGFSLSAWLVLALKTLPFAGVGISQLVLLSAIAIQCGATALAWPKARGLYLRHRALVWSELAAHSKSLVLLSVLSVWWFYMSHIHYLFKRGNDHIAGGSVYADRE